MLKRLQKRDTPTAQWTQKIACHKFYITLNDTGKNDVCGLSHLSINQNYRFYITNLLLSN